ncbi:MAG: cell division protein ZapA [Clostridiales bacterium]|nr:cell division protein ZapA [Clostridiales bacterium]
MEKIRTTVRIAGKDYAMVGYDSEEYVRRVAIYVDRKIQELSVATRLPSADLAVLTAINIADDMLKAHDENTRLRKELLQLRQELLAAQKELIELRGAPKGEG